MSRRLLIASLLLAMVVGLGIFITQRPTHSPQETSGASNQIEDVVEEEVTSVAVETENNSANTSASKPTTTPAQAREDSSATYDRSYPTKIRKSKSSAMASPQELKGMVALQGTPWKVWSGTWAVPEGVVSSQEVVAQIANFDIVKEQALTEKEAGSAKTVVFDPQLGNTGVVSGNLILECANIKNCAAIDFSDEVEVITRIESMGIIYIRPLSSQYDIQKYYSLFKADSNFKSVRLEILGNNYDRF